MFLSTITGLNKNWDMGIRFVEVKSEEFSHRLKDEVDLLKLLKKAQDFYANLGNTKNQAT